jgi:hypothetical protein
VFTRLGFRTSSCSYDASRHSPIELVGLKHVAASHCCVPLMDAIPSLGFVPTARAIGVRQYFVSMGAQLNV